MSLTLLAFLLVSLAGYGSSVDPDDAHNVHSTDPDLPNSTVPKIPDPDDALPVYMRGMNWSRVQQHLKSDLRLSNDVIPTNYEISLHVSVRGHAGAEISNFFGTVSISLNVTNPVDQIELHSMGLAILSTELIGSASIPIGISNKSNNTERETITFHVNRTIDAQEKVILKATFELRVNHPDSLTAYSNTKADTVTSHGDGRMISSFAKTNLLATYQVALSVNHYPVQFLEIEGVGKVRLAMSTNSHDYYSSIPTKWDGLGEVNDIRKLIEQLFGQIKDFEFGVIPQDMKLDIIILEGTRTISVQPGLITIGRANLWRNGNPTSQIKHLEQVRIGNQISLRSVNQLWLNGIFSRMSMNETVCENLVICSPDDIWEASLHERPLRDEMVHATSTKQYLASRNKLSTLKATHLLRLALRYCPPAETALKKYTIDHVTGFASIDDFIFAMSNSCDQPDIAKEFLFDYINQSGKAFLIVNRTGDVVTIKQTRYHSTYFDEGLRDTRTRYTIPIFYTIDGNPGMKVFHKNDTSITISIPRDSLFLIDPNYDYLYLAYYETIIVPLRNLTEKERLSVVQALPKTMVAALNIGYVKWSVIQEQLNIYAKRHIFGNHDQLGVFFTAKHLITGRMEREYVEDESRMVILRYCSNGDRPSWNDMFNDEAKYWEYPLNFVNRESALFVHCMSAWANSTQFHGFLEQNFLGANTVIRPAMYPYLMWRHDVRYQWRDLHRFFFREAADAVNHRVNLLAELVLMHGKIEDTREYPDATLYEDYLKELRRFVLRNPLRAASMSTEIEKKLEREFVRAEMPKWHNVDEREMEREFFATYRDVELTEN